MHENSPHKQRLGGKGQAMVVARGVGIMPKLG